MLVHQNVDQRVSFTETSIDQRATVYKLAFTMHAQCKHGFCLFSQPNRVCVISV